MTNKVVIVFTFKSVEHLLQDGGTLSWRLDRSHARTCEFAVCTRNAHSPGAEGSEDHRSAFLVGKVKDVVPSPERGYEDRFLIQFSEYALVNVPDVWGKGDRNPVRYARTLEEVGIDASKLDWKPMPERMPQERTPSTSSSKIVPLTITEAKNGLAVAFNVPPEAIEITIRG